MSSQKHLHHRGLSGSRPEQVANYNQASTMLAVLKKPTDKGDLSEIVGKCDKQLY